MRFLVGASALLLAACGSSDEPAASNEGDAAEGQAAQAGEAPSEAAAGDAAQSPGGYDPDSSEPQVANAEDFAEVAAAQMDGTDKWALPGVVELSGPVGNTILDEPPYAYIAFGGGPTDVDVFAEMEPVFAQQQQYGRDDFYDADGKVSVMCLGPVMRPSAESPPVVRGCTAVFRD